MTANADFALPDIHGQQHWLSDWQGKLVVLNFWATWCTPCRQEIPHFVKLQKQYAGKIQVVSIAIDTPDASTAYAKEMGINYPVLLAADTGPDIMAGYGNTQGALPYTIVLGRDGMLRSKKLGAFSESELNQLFESLANGDSTTTLSK
jgi:thiol-disulfide isomerase/thioredoxin